MFLFMSHIHVIVMSYIFNKCKCFTYIYCNSFQFSHRMWGKDNKIQFNSNNIEKLVTWHFFSWLVHKNKAALQLRQLVVHLGIHHINYWNTTDMFVLDTSINGEINQISWVVYFFCYISVANKLNITPSFNFHIKM